ncbi:homeobox protein HAT3.1 isoform X1 [Cryptomeria japonica]|uniref:homeobox protein HAT3.1 isoform X1 n=1 Tax=Cryptomeria japonica TaxID=3369 RepID=UPI0027DA090A|nr:homeobox protein HAT3.1 isoform X1 [Cryptomeria japonica]XP_059074155.1 homeobox protein HAT3.1 isoform X1 [Cryptomeria japonica]
MARDKVHKASSETKKVLREVNNSGKKSNLANGGTSETPDTLRKRNQKSKKQDHPSDGEKNDSTAANLIETNHLESEELELEKDMNQKSSKSATKARKGKPPAGKKYVLRSLSNGVRVLRPRSNKNEKTLCKSDGNALESSAEKSTERKRKNKKRKHIQHDELSRIRKRVKYFLLRIGFEQNMIDAYSSEGWKGQSQEKIRPEKELQKAASKISQLKLQIREGFHQLHTLLLEGVLEEAAFDSQGQVNSEDIFCAKCRSKDLFPDNDIVLCDGACDRGFHQKCLEPPLATEDIPPGDEGWLCPGCDCKLDCLDLVNDYLGTEFELEDGWEKIFADTAAIVAGDEVPLDLEDMPSDDTEDDDYDPDTLELPDDRQQEGSRSEESFGTNDTSNSSDSSSDDEGYESGEGSESDEASQSSLEGDSENFSEHLVGSRKKKFKMARDKNAQEISELPKISDVDEKDDITSPVSGKRHRQEVDYKKLHDELYGLDASDKSMSEDDEEWGLGKRSKKGSLANMEQGSSSMSKGKQLGNISVSKKKVKALDVKPPEDNDRSKSTLFKKGKSEKENGESAVAQEIKHIEQEFNAEILPLDAKFPTKENAARQQQPENSPASAKQNTSSRMLTSAVEEISGHATSDKSNSKEKNQNFGKRSKKKRQPDAGQDNSSISKGKKQNKASVTKRKGKAAGFGSPEDDNQSKPSVCKMEKKDKQNEECAQANKENYKDSSHAEILPLEFKSPTKESDFQQQQEQCGSSSVSAKRRSFSRLPTAAVEKFRSVFGEIRFPSRSLKEDLAKEFGISFKKVHKWFDNARNHPQASAGKKQTVTVNQDSTHSTPIKDNKVPVESNDTGRMEKVGSSAKSFSEQVKKMGRRKHGNNEIRSPTDTGAKFVRNKRRDTLPL